VYRIYRELKLNFRIKPLKRLKREKPDALVVPELPNEVWSKAAMHASAPRWFALHEEINVQAL
jgi:hypothetical protein